MEYDSPRVNALVLLPELQDMIFEQETQYMDYAKKRKCDKLPHPSPLSQE